MVCTPDPILGILALSGYELQRGQTQDWHTCTHKHTYRDTHRQTRTTTIPEVQWEVIRIDENPNWTISSIYIACFTIRLDFRQVPECASLYFVSNTNYVLSRSNYLCDRLIRTFIKGWFEDNCWHNTRNRHLAWEPKVRHRSWRRHQMEPFSALLALCAGNSPVPGEFPAQRPVTRSFDVVFGLRLRKQLNKQSWGWWFETRSRSLWHCNVS